LLPVERLPVLSLIVWLPLLGAIVLMGINRENLRALRWTAVGFAGVTFLLSVAVTASVFASGSAGTFSFVEEYRWISALNIKYKMAVDGLSTPLLALTTLLTLVSVIYSLHIDHRVKEYFVFFLMLETGMNGVFCALDFFLFYIFWELSLVPMYFLIGIWGGPQKEYAAIKFFLYTLVGSLAMLLAVLALYFHFDPHTFDFTEMAQRGAAGETLFAGPEFVKGALIFWGLFVGFAIKVPMFPFHTWLPLAHVEAPTAGSVILAGVLLKMGTYGFVRVCLPILPHQCQAYAWIVAVLAVISVIYGALCAMAQKDMKKLVAYSSVNHMGYVMLGVAAAMAWSFGQGGPLPPGADEALALKVEGTALNGAVLQMVNHGIITGALFLLVGVIYDRAHLRDLDAFGGLANKMPAYSGVLTLAAMASLGLPALAGFVSEFTILIGAFGVYKLFTCLSALGIVITAGFFLWMLQRMLLGDLPERWAGLKDMDAREWVSLAPLAFLMILIGLYPAWIMNPINQAMSALLELIHP
jgi:NADH-quinone oxidoreductase subunit M